ncbi:glycosyltransferase [Microbacterium sp. NPDC056569]|uniref:glycosyltransferase n=1 Tax=Microbacterium sp. NPDC056569 TaxID=3345867 RepID=UPI00366A7350
MSGAVVHEWVELAGGSERVVDAVLGATGATDLYCLWDNSGGRFGEGVRITESHLARTPLRGRKAAALPIMPAAWRSIRANAHHDWLFVSSHLFAHHVRLRGISARTPKYVYVHTPARYIWAPELDGRGTGFIPRAISRTLKPLDRARSGEAASLMANSEFIRARISEAWRQDAGVLYPPVEVAALQAVPDWSRDLSDIESSILHSLPEGFVLGASRFVPYKRLDWVVKAAEAADVPVVLAGGGPEVGSLRRLLEKASVPGFLVERPSDALLYALYQRARAFVFPAIEDFGIMPVEAQALGTPTVTTSFGGATETVSDGVSGAIAEEDTVAGVARALTSVLDSSSLTPAAHAQKFSRERFEKGLQTWLPVHA